MKGTATGSILVGAARALIGVLATFLLANCTGFGSKHARVRLVTQPERAEAFVVPQERWYSGGKALYQAFSQSTAEQRASELMRLLTWLEPFRVRSGLTPVEHSVAAHQQVLVAKLDETIDYAEFDPLELPVDANGGGKYVRLELHRADEVAP